jgi:tetratricopeptide (TPR) repeat protein
MITKEQVLTLTGVLATTSITAVGFAIGGTIGAQVMGAIGINLWSNIIQNGAVKLKDQWLSSQDGILNHDIQQALVRAFIKALSILEKKYFALEETKKLPKEKKEAIETLFRELNDKAQTVFLPSITKAVNEQEVKSYLYGKPQESKNALWKRIDETNLIYTYYGEHFKTFLRDNCLNEVVFWFGEELKTDNKECNKAWRAFQRMLLEGIQADVKAVQVSQDIIQRDLQTLSIIREQLDRIKDAFDHRLPDEPFQESFTKALTEIQSILKDVVQTTTRTEEKIDVIAADVKTLLDSKTEKRIVQLRPTLPSPPLDFTGREDELNELRAMVKSGSVMIISLHGMGGVGKTALALKLADEVKDNYPDGQIYLDLKGVSRRSESGPKQEPLTSMEVMSHVIHAWYPEEKLPDNKTELAGFYHSVLADKRVLLLFDNARNAAQLTPLITINRHCLLLVTSRQRFGLGGREPYDIEKLRSDDAVRLLHNNSSRLSQHDAKEIAEICDYLPMALKPAVSLLNNSRRLTPKELIKKLRDKKQLLSLKDAERKDELINMSIEASFQLSYELLAEDEISELPQRWRMLAVFPDTFDEAAAAAVWVLDEDAARDSLDALDSYSLIEITEVSDTKALRYGLHDVARDFADARLDDDERNSAQQRHAIYYQQVLSVANELYMQGKDAMTQGLLNFDQERANIQEGHKRAERLASLDDQSAKLCIDYAYLGRNILYLRLDPNEFIRWQETALSGSQRLQKTATSEQDRKEYRRAEGYALCLLGHGTADLGEETLAVEYYQQSLLIAQETIDRFLEGRLLGNIGLIYTELNEFEKAIQYYRQSLDISREIDDKQGESITLGNWGLNHDKLGEVVQAIERYQQAKETAHVVGDLKNEGLWLNNLGNIYRRLGNLDLAIECFEQAAKAAHELSDPKNEINRLRILVLTYQDKGEQLLILGMSSPDRELVQSAIYYYKRALETAHMINNQEAEATILDTLITTYTLLGEVSEVIECYEQKLAIHRYLGGDKETEGSILTQLSYKHATCGKAEDAVKYCEQAFEVHQKLGDKRGQANDLSNMAIALAVFGDEQAATDCIHRASALAEELDDAELKGMILEDQGDACLRRGEVDMANQFFAEALKIYDEIGSSRANGVSQKLSKLFHE